jgi:hypothetical protein
MGILDNIVGNITRDVEYGTSRGVTDALKKGVEKITKKGNSSDLKKCPKCKAAITEGARVCGQCGEKLVFTCTQGHDNPYSTKFCTICGEKFKQK